MFTGKHFKAKVMCYAEFAGNTHLGALRDDLVQLRELDVLGEDANLVPCWVAHNCL